MKKNLLRIGILASFVSNFLFTTQVTAQTSKVSFGPVLKDPGKTYINEILSSDNDGFYALRTDLTTLKALTNASENFSIERYNQKNELVFSKPLPLRTGSKGKPNNFEALISVQNSLFLISSKLNEAAGQYFVYATKLDAKGEPVGTPLELARSEKKTKKENAYFDIAISPDKSKILVLEGLKTPDVDAAKYQIKVLDPNFKEVYSKLVNKSLPAANIVLKGQEIDNTGNVFLYLTTYRTSLNKEVKDPLNRFLVYNPSQDKIKEFDIALTGKTLADLTYAFDKNQQLAVAGLYANNNPLDRSGAFFTRIDPQSEKLQSINIKAFSPELLSEFKGRTKKKNEPDGIAYMKINKLLFREDGSAVLAAEQASWYQVDFIDGSGRSRGTVYHYENNDALIINISTEGQLGWITRIPKMQHTLDDDGDFNGIAIGAKLDKIYMIYNENSKNVNVQGTKELTTMKNASDAVPVLVTITNTGDYQKEPLLSAKDKNAPLQPRYHHNNNNSLIIYGKRDNSYRFGNILYN